MRNTRRRASAFVAALLLVFVSLPHANAQGPLARAAAPPRTPVPDAAAPFAPAEFKPSVRRVAVFKNGYVFTYREGEARPAAGWAYTTDVPSGVLGAVWGYTTSPQARVTQLLASEADKLSSNRVANLAELLLV
ncbi:MAG TPA: hypothetical protein VGV38_08070, partial [Pyrinomonadaceae bacterium]|nr:hypothetical protein [Pyrinomonadaceae bacterium]